MMSWLLETAQEADTKCRLCRPTMGSSRKMIRTEHEAVGSGDDGATNMALTNRTQRISYVVSLPSDYGFVQKGDPYKTRWCRKLTYEAREVLYMIENNRKYKEGANGSDQAKPSLWRNLMNKPIESNTESNDLYT